jgi:hypothetical protein
LQAENGRSSTSPVGWGIKKAVPGEERLCAVSGNTQLPGLAGLVILSTPALGLLQAGLWVRRDREGATFSVTLRFRLFGSLHYSGAIHRSQSTVEYRRGKFPVFDDFVYSLQRLEEL